MLTSILNFDPWSQISDWDWHRNLKPPVDNAKKNNLCNFRQFVWPKQLFSISDQLQKVKQCEIYSNEDTCKVLFQWASSVLQIEEDFTKCEKFTEDH